MLRSAFLGGAGVGLLGLLLAAIRDLPGILFYASWWEATSIVAQAGLIWIAAFGCVSIAGALIAGAIAKIARLDAARSDRLVSATTTAVLAGLAAAVLSWMGVHWLQGALGARIDLSIPDALRAWLLVTGLIGLVACLQVGREALVGAAKRLAGWVFPFAVLSGAVILGSSLWQLRLPAHDALHTSGSRPPDILLVVVDTVASKRTSLYGRTRDTTPNMRRFAGNAHAFSDVVSSANFTTAGMAAMLTGTHPVRNHVYALEGSIKSDVADASLPAALKDAGYQVAAFVGNPWAHPVHLGLAHSFDLAPPALMRSPDRLQYYLPTSIAGINSLGFWNSLWVDLRLMAGQLPWLEHETPYGARTVFDSAREFLVNRSDHRPLFLWVHVFPPHDPYLPPTGFLGIYGNALAVDTLGEQLPYLHRQYLEHEQPMIDLLADRYDEMLRYADAELGRFISSPEVSRLIDRGVTVITSDHGESFEKGFIGHNEWPLHQSLIEVPLLVRLPFQKSGSTSEEPLQLVDLAPTLARLAGVSLGAGIDGRAIEFAPTQGSGAGVRRPRYSMALYDVPAGRKPRRGTVAVLDGRMKLFWNLTLDSAALYDLKADPAERHDLASGAPVEVERLKRLAEQDLGVEASPAVSH